MKPMASPVISLTTDFGADLFVGVMKGVIAAINPDARVIDLTHAVPPGDVRAGAFALMAGAEYFPEGTIHAAVVDPGVGSSRRILCVQTREFVYLAPDNGLLSWCLEREEILAARSVENAQFFLGEVSRTFHGRDIFAPVAARLSLGVMIEDLGPEVKADHIARIPFPKPSRPDGATLAGEVLYIDHFGNAITNLPAAELAGADPARVRVEAGTLAISGLSQSYSEASPGAALTIIGSAGFLELAASGAGAAKQFGLRVGDVVTVRMT